VEREKEWCEASVRGRGGVFIAEGGSGECTGAVASANHRARANIGAGVRVTQEGIHQQAGFEEVGLGRLKGCITWGQKFMTGRSIDLPLSMPTCRGARERDRARGGVGLG
jgi:hypothetical protein